LRHGKRHKLATGLTVIHCVAVDFAFIASGIRSAQTPASICVNILGYRAGVVVHDGGVELWAPELAVKHQPWR